MRQGLNHSCFIKNSLFSADAVWNFVRYHEELQRRFGRKWKSEKKGKSYDAISRKLTGKCIDNRQKQYIIGCVKLSLADFTKNEQEFFGAG